jgi:hypothetical protein
MGDATGQAGAGAPLGWGRGIGRMSGLLGLLWAFGMDPAWGAEWRVRQEDKAPPTALGESIRSLLDTKSVQVLEGEKPVWEFWLAKQIPLKGRPEAAAKALDQVKSPTLLGAVLVTRDQRDYRDDELKAGLYTMRYDSIPSDGNHLGAAEYSHFALLVPAAADPKPDAIGTPKALFKASSKETSTFHAVLLSLRPSSEGGGEPPKMLAPIPDHRSVRVETTGKVAEETIPLVFEIVVEGKGHR